MSDEGLGQEWGCSTGHGKYDPRSFSFARSFRRHGGMKYYVLWLLSERPMRGSEIIDEVQKQTMGWWRPSPGTVYPLLNALEKEGMMKRLDDLRYEIQEAGAEEIGLKLGKPRSQGGEAWNLDRVITELEGYTSYLEEEQDGLSKYGERIEGIIERLSKLKIR